MLDRPRTPRSCNREARWKKRLDAVERERRLESELPIFPSEEHIIPRIYRPYNSSPVYIPRIISLSSHASVKTYFSIVIRDISDTWDSEKWALNQESIHTREIPSKPETVTEWLFHLFSHICLISRIICNNDRTAWHRCELSRAIQTITKLAPPRGLLLRPTPRNSREDNNLRRTPEYPVRSAKIIYPGSEGSTQTRFVLRCDKLKPNSAGRAAKYKRFTSHPRHRAIRSLRSCTH